MHLEAWHNNQQHSILLNNVLHIPAAHSNLISGVQLDKAGVVSTLGNNSILLSVNNKVLISGTVVNDMYRLNLTVIRPNPISLASHLSPLTLHSRISPTASSTHIPSAFCTA